MATKVSGLILEFIETKLDQLNAKVNIYRALRGGWR